MKFKLITTYVMLCCLTARGINKEYLDAGMTLGNYLEKL